MDSLNKLSRRAAARRVHVETILRSCLDSSSDQPLLKLNNGKSCGRIRVLGIVVNKYIKNNLQDNKGFDYNSDIWSFSSNSYTSIDLDDSTGVINVRAWGDQAARLNNYNIGDIVEIIGKPREYNGRLYVIYESGFIVDDIHWWLLHELEILVEDLEELNDADSADEQASGNVNKRIINKLIENKFETGLSSHKLGEDSLVDRLMDAICKLDKGDGVLLTDIREELKAFKADEIEDVLNQLIKEGTLYECKPQRYQKFY
ncbi:MAG: OB-fold nucleic acid binding domain-containing protein [Candidatus Odinarchaeum yellowstonii]|uniref:OB-fold nucleic acid binding domain-containing protein n=1 Tax=Odinarchaeota yellowstonii (strain LCB_4) TaxID=1841599 RepID=A0AAF0IBU9_ODILC|nr:MAG: OB-fold nucleic acid binding domain-containing protein [Candidatus Odinarchaeum yellowstonii]